MAENRKAMISQPMGGKTDDEIVSTRDRALMALEQRGYSTVNTLFADEWYSSEAIVERGVVQIPLCFLAKSLEKMSLCHAAYFCKGWENARGCRIEHEAAKAYGLEIIYEEIPAVSEKIKNNFTYHVPKPGQPEQYQAIRDKAKELACLIDELAPNSREKSLAMTKLEECAMWANAGIARN